MYQSAPLRDAATPDCQQFKCCFLTQSLPAHTLPAMQIWRWTTAFVLLATIGSTALAGDEPVRVVSLAPSITEIVCAVGGASNLVGRTSFCNYPPNVVANVPIVGGFGLPSMEALLTIHPTYILEVDLEDESLVKQLHEVGLERRRITCQKLDEIPPAIEEVGKLLQHTEQAHALATQLADSLAELRRNAPPKEGRPRVFLQIWSDPIMTATPRSFLSELLNLAGGENICTNGISDFIQVSSEWVVGTDPDVILCLEGDGTTSTRQLVMTRPGWESIRAVKSGRVYDHFNMDVLTRPGPRVLEGVQLLRTALSPTNSIGSAPSP